MKAQNRIEEEIEIINYIIDCAIDHGGDTGGAYYSAGNSLCEAIQEWLTFRNLCDNYVLESTVTGDVKRGYKIIRKQGDPQIG